MPKHRSIFFRMNLVILFLLLPILLLYAYTNQTSLQVINKEIVSNNENQLFFLKQQMETIVNRFTFLPSTFSRDSSVLNIEKSVLTKDYYGMTQYKPILEEKLYLQSFSGGWKNDLTVYLPDVQMRISTDKNDVYDPAHIQKVTIGKWNYHAGQDANSYFDFYFSDPWKKDLTKVNAVFETKIYSSSIQNMLETYKGESNRDPFVLTDGGEVISTGTANAPLIQELKKKLTEMRLGEQGHMELNINGQEFFTAYVFIPSLNVYLIDYLPLESVISPIIKSRNLFYTCTALLVLLSFVALVLLYRYVQVPIAELIKALKAFERGDFSFKISKIFHNEFDFLTFRYNEMAAQIKHLIENVYEEQNRSRLATLKQLQSQINPHFLYNCLSFIAGSAKIGLNETVMDMAYCLSDYYRYATRVENQTPVLRQEIDLIETYLIIYRMRLERIDYVIDIPEEMMNANIPRLILQPIVENAIVHGLEPKMGSGLIKITGRREGDDNIIVVEDDGVGMSNESLLSLQLSLNNSLNEDMGCGLWNVCQRLKYRFGNESELTLSPSRQSTGLCVTLRWNSNHNEEVANDETNSAHGRRAHALNKYDGDRLGLGWR